MKKIYPFQDFQAAKKELDNGGRFLDFASRASDGVIAFSELRKATAVRFDNIKMLLFFDLKTNLLSPDDKSAIVNMFAPPLRQYYTKYKPHLLASPDLSNIAEGKYLLLRGALEPSSDEVLLAAKDLNLVFMSNVVVPIKSNLAETNTVLDLVLTNTEATLPLPVLLPRPRTFYPKGNFLFGAIIRKLYISSSGSTTEVVVSRSKKLLKGEIQDLSFVEPLYFAETI